MKLDPQRFYGHVEGGKFHLSSKAVYDAYLKHLEGERGYLEVGPIPNKRSDRQNRYIQQATRIFAQSLSTDHDAMRHALCGKFWGWKESPLEPGMQIPEKTTSQATVEEMSSFIEWLPSFGMDLNILIPLPNEDER